MKLPRLLFSVEGQLDRRTYLITALPVFFLQHAFVLLCVRPFPELDRIGLAGLLFNPLRLVLGASVWVALPALGLGLVTAWVLVALSFRRARKDGADLALVAPIVMPALQLPIILLLCVLPARKPTAGPTRRATGVITMPAVVAALSGMLICVTACAFGTLVFGNYGFSLFMATPLVVGVTAGWIVNRKSDIGAVRTNNVVLASLLLGALAIAGVAIEGLLCLALATPIIVALGSIGGAIGRVAAKSMKGGQTTLSGLAILPFLFLAEAAFPPKADFVSIETIEVAATPEDVWWSITHMGEIAEAPGAPFGWGLAYPVAGEIEGAGVGALRKGVFSTGIAYERVTVWDPGRELSFDVLSDPPALKELSPYDHVQAPHLAGYFSTAYAKFTLTPLGGGRTRLALETRHSLDLEPAVYWMPIAQWAIHENKTRVLTHFARRAEAGPHAN